MTTASIAPITQDEFAGLFGIARATINPPADMYVRTWGSAKHDIADGLHRDLTVTCMVIAADATSRPCYFMAIDLMTWLSKMDEAGFREPLEKELGLQPGEMILHISHTHGAPFTDTLHADKPGGELIATYRDEISAACRRVVDEARASMKPATLTWAKGKCGLAYNRDLVMPETGEILCGLNPEAVVDDTLLVGRVADAAGKIVATLVNYAAHPTSVGGGNRLVSPDYIGAMREIVERDTDGAICVFLHGADGDLTPRRAFEDDVEAADQNGRELGYAALSVLNSMFPPGHRMAFLCREESGTALGRWKIEPVESVPTAFEMRVGKARLEKMDLPSAEELRQRVANAATSFEKERAERMLSKSEKLGEGAQFDMPVFVWRMGPSVFVGAPGEMFNRFQTELRARFPHLTIAVLNLCNGSYAYLPTIETYEKDVYPVRIALFKPGCAETVLATASKLISEMTA